MKNARLHVFPKGFVLKMPDIPKIEHVVWREGSDIPASIDASGVRFVPQGELDGFRIRLDDLLEAIEIWMTADKIEKREAREWVRERFRDIANWRAEIQGKTDEFSPKTPPVDDIPSDIRTKEEHEAEIVRARAKKVIDDRFQRLEDRIDAVERLLTSAGYDPAHW